MQADASRRRASTCMYIVLRYGNFVTIIIINSKVLELVCAADMAPEGVLTVVQGADTLVYAGLLPPGDRGIPKGQLLRRRKVVDWVNERVCSRRCSCFLF